MGLDHTSEIFHQDLEPHVHLRHHGWDCLIHSLVAVHPAVP